jgi:hypothetical protein
VDCSENNPAAFYRADYGEPLLSFERPGDDIRERLAALLAELPIEHFRENATGEFAPGNAAARGSLSAVLAALMADLDGDHRENQAKSAEWDGGFDYRVFESIFIPGGAEVLTRLFYHSGDGQLYYGRAVQRIARDEYLLWIVA